MYFQDYNLKLGQGNLRIHLSEFSEGTFIQFFRSILDIATQGLIQFISVSDQHWSWGLVTTKLLKY